jgi:hypothetical protein
MGVVALSADSSRGHLYLWEWSQEAPLATESQR